MAELVHELKTWPPYFKAVLSGEKTFELRYDDRAFAVGDILLLQEFDPKSRYTGREMRRRITYIADVASWVPGAPLRWVVLGLGDADPLPTVSAVGR